MLGSFKHTHLCWSANWQELEQKNIFSKITGTLNYVVPDEKNTRLTHPKSARNSMSSKSSFVHLSFVLSWFLQTEKETTTSVFATSACVCVNTGLRVYRLLGVTHVFLTDNMVHCMFGVWCYLCPVVCTGSVQFLRSLQDFLKSPLFKPECPRCVFMLLSGSNLNLPNCFFFLNGQIT